MSDGTPVVKRISSIENEVQMVDNAEHLKELQDSLIEAGFVVKEGSAIAPDWETEIGKHQLNNLDLAQIDELLKIAHRDLAGRIALDVKSKGISVEDAYMARATTDPAATLIAEATVARNAREKSLHAELGELKEKAGIKTTAREEEERLGKAFDEALDGPLSPNEKRGLEQVKFMLKKEIQKNPENAQEIRTEAAKSMKDSAIEWKDPEKATQEIVSRAKAKDKEKEAAKPEVSATPEKRKLSDLSTSEFVRLAAKAYVSSFNEALERNPKPEIASTVAVAHIKELAKKAQLRISLKDVPEQTLLNASKSPEAVAKILNDRVKPSRMATITARRENGNDLGR